MKNEHAKIILFRGSLLTIMANTVNIKHVVMNREIVLFLHMLNNFLEPGVGKLFHFPAYLTNDMLVLLVVISPFELGDVITELMLDDEFTIQEKVNRVVQRGPTHPVILVLHKHVQGLYIEMPRVGIYFIQYGIAFRRFAMPLLLQVIRKNFFYRFLYFIH